MVLAILVMLRSLIDKGYKVHIIDNLSTGNIKLIPKNASFTNCNINDEKQIAQIVKLIILIF